MPGSLVALAASLLLAFTLPVWVGGPIRWDVQDFGQPLQTRGGEVVPGSQPDVRALGKTFAQTLEKAYLHGRNESGAWGRKEWTLSLRMQSMAFGGLNMEVEGLRKNTSKPQIWTMTCRGGQELSPCLESFAQEIAKDMTSFTANERE